MKTYSIQLLCTWILMFTFFNGYSWDIWKSSVEKRYINNEKLISIAEKHFQDKDYILAISTYKEVLKSSPKDSVLVFKKLAFSFAKQNNAIQASAYIEKYIKASLDVAFVGHSYFDQISSYQSYKLLEDKYLKKIDLWSLFCLYVGFIGIFVFTVLNFKKTSDRTANFLISFFLLLHSLFMIRISILLTNYEYYLPHTLYISASFSFLYGPTIYFYFKRVIQKYTFKSLDLLHLIPTFLFVVLMFPVYTLPETEKLKMILHNERPHMWLILISKLLSLIIYGTLVFTMYIKSIRNNKAVSKIERNWQRDIVIFSLVYIISYTIYAFLIKNYMISGILFNLQVVSMALLVIYISYNAFARLTVLDEYGVNHKKPKAKLEVKPDKYKTSNLTKEMSKELKDQLLYLLNEKQIYKQNDITLQKLSELLDTTRHNTSQVINEHFGLNFFDFINSYRIREANAILKNKRDQNLTIIDVAYEVGFNNKVTFNKSFKKYNQTTPSEYIKSLIA